MSAALLIDIILWGSVIAVGFIAFQRGPTVLTSSLREGTMDFIGIVPRIALGVVGSGYIAALLPQDVMGHWFGADSGGGNTPPRAELHERLEMRVQRVDAPVADQTDQVNGAAGSDRVVAGAEKRAILEE